MATDNAAYRSGSGFGFRLPILSLGESGRDRWWEGLLATATRRARKREYSETTIRPGGRIRCRATETFEEIVHEPKALGCSGLPEMVRAATKPATTEATAPEP